MEKSRVFGGKCTGLLAIYDQELQCWKTCQLSLFEEVERYSEALPKSGMMQNGQLYQLDNLEPHTLDADGFLLPTPTAQDAKQGFSPSQLNRCDNMHKAIHKIHHKAIGKDTRLHPRFVEWMMGFPIGWLD